MKKFIMFLVLLFVGFSSSARSQVYLVNEHQATEQQYFDKYPIPQKQLTVFKSNYITIKQQYGTSLVYGIGHIKYAPRFGNKKMKWGAHEFANKSLEIKLDRLNPDVYVGVGQMYFQDIYGGWYCCVYGYTE